MMRFKQNIILLFLIFCSFKIEAQDSGLHFEQISYDDDFSPSMISSMVQNTKGFIWIGTENGLFRYDGLRWVKIEDNVRITKTNTDDRANYKTKFINQSGTTTINGLTVEQRQALTDALKPKADN